MVRFYWVRVREALIEEYKAGPQYIQVVLVHEGFLGHANGIILVRLDAHI
jgi:hypothetical protein